MTDRYRLQESADRIRATVPCEITLTDDHRAILSAASKLVHMSAILESKADEITGLQSENAKLRAECGELLAVAKSIYDDAGGDLIGLSDSNVERLEAALSRQKAVQTTEDAEPTYPCDDCGAPRTKSQGGTIFTVCDDCWDRRRAEREDGE